MAETAQNLQGTDVIAKIFDVSTRRVRQLTEEGIIHAVKQKGANKYDLLPTVQAYIRYLSSKANGRDAKSSDASEAKERAEADLKTSKAAIEKLKLEELKGRMHRSEDVAAMTSDLVYAVRSMIIALPGRLAMDVADNSNAAECSEIIRKECYLILEELSKYEYDPDAYAKRVRDREGWTEAVMDDEPDDE
jgi:phage terminase Nu1 subunit (DNA packaging protein)